LQAGTGLKFADLSARKLLDAIDRAIAAFQDKDGWHRLMLNGMAEDFSWKKPAREYAAVYTDVARKVGS
jgi:starch synthase